MLALIIMYSGSSARRDVGYFRARIQGSGRLGWKCADFRLEFAFEQRRGHSRSPGNHFNASGLAQSKLRPTNRFS